MKLWVLAALAFVSASSLRADTLYWMVEEDLSKPYDLVWLYGQKDVSSTVDPIGSPFVLAHDVALDNYTADISGYGDGSVFYIELSSETEGWVRSDSVMFKTLHDGGYIVGPSGVPPAYYSGWTVSSVPEPTSGLMLLLGTALLALRRKRA